MSFSKILSGIIHVLSAVKTLPRIVRAKLFSGNQGIIDNSINSFYRGHMPLAESQGVEAIETIRKSMLQSDAKIPRIEFGKGSNTLSNTTVTERISDVCRVMSKPKRECLFLFYLLKTLKPIQCLELGTCLGISSAYIGMAIRQNGQGRLVTFEGSPARAKIAEININDLGLAKNVKVIEGRFQNKVGEHLKEIGYIDFAFIDGHHQQDATIGYFNQLLPKFLNGGIMVFDDVFWSSGMNRAWKKIKKSDPVIDSFVFKGMGIIEVGISA